MLALLYIPILNAQETTKIDKKNEIRVDVLSLVTTSKLNVSFERFLDKRASIGVTTGFLLGGKTKDDFQDGVRNNLPKYEIIPYFRYNLSKELKRFYFAEIFVNANGGDFKEIIRKVDANQNGYYTTEQSTYSDVALGASVGYKMYFKEKYALEFIVGYGKNILNTDKSPDNIPRVGLNFGYRF